MVGIKLSNYRDVIANLCYRAMQSPQLTPQKTFMELIAQSKVVYLKYSAKYRYLNTVYKLMLLGTLLPHNYCNIAIYDYLRD